MLVGKYKLSEYACGLLDFLQEKRVADTNTNNMIAEVSFLFIKH